VITPPAAIAVRSAANVQLADVPEPTTVVGVDTSAAIARAGKVALVQAPGLPVGPIVLPVIGPPSPPPCDPGEDPPHAAHANKQIAPLIVRSYYGRKLARRVL
jgi:hypothetical protein